MIVSSVVDMTLDLVAMSAIGCGIIMVVAFWALARRRASATIMKSIVVVWCFLGFVLAIVPAIYGIT